MEGNSVAVFENLCKIFEMRIKLDREKGIETPDDVISNYEKYSKKIDLIYNDEFRQTVKPLIAPAKTLDGERSRLKRLISLLEERLSKREELEDKFYVATGMTIRGLQPVVSEDELNEKKKRLDLICKYLDTTKEIKALRESVDEMKKTLSEEEAKKEEYATKNEIIEDELLETFLGVIKEDDFYRELVAEDLERTLEEVIDKVTETKETLEVTRESVNSLLTNGSNDDYSSYVEEAERTYYVWKNRELTLKIYKILIQKKESFNEIYHKREEIYSIFEERKNLRANLKIVSIDELLEFEKVLLEEKTVLENEKTVLENIANYTNRIKFKEEKLEELEEVNNSVEILAILREYGLIETYDVEEKQIETIPDEQTSIQEETPIIEVIDPYRIIAIKDYPITLNIGLAKAKGESIRDKVNKKLNPEKTKEPTFSEDFASLISSYQPATEIKDESPNDMSDKDSTPVWDLPIDTTISNVPEKELPSPAMTNEVKIDIAPHMEPAETTDNNINITSNNSSTFWVPVSDSKIEAGNFPNLDIPVENNLNKGKDNFGFPEFPEV